MSKVKTISSNSNFVVELYNTNGTERVVIKKNNIIYNIKKINKIKVNTIE
jgi:hypothetical protein